MKIREKARELGYTDAQCITGEPFTLWRDRLKGTYHERMAPAHDPTHETGWNREETTIWVALTRVPHVPNWP